MNERKNELIKEKINEKRILNIHNEQTLWIHNKYEWTQHMNKQHNEWI